MAYQPTIPTGLIDLDQDYLNIQGNFQQLDTTFGIDHFAFSNATTSNGIHKQVSLPLSSSPPILPAADLVLYARNENGIPALWIKNSTLDLPVSGPTSAGNNGYVSMFGGIIMQWGIVPIPTGSAIGGLVTFLLTGNNIDFPNAIFHINLQLIGKTPPTASSNNSLFVEPGYDKTHFNWIYRGGSDDFTKLFWIAIGN